MKKLLFLLLSVNLVLFNVISSSYAGDVQDNNRNRRNDILIGTGLSDINGNSIGTWTKPSAVPVIATNIENISKNEENISSNDTDIITNTSNISTNKTNITTNTTDISTNANNVETNKLKNVEQDRRLDDHDNRIGDLEETEINIKGEVQFYRGKNVTMGIYAKTDMRHPNINNEVGLNIIIGIGKSWTEKEIDKVKNKIKALENKLDWIGVEPEIEKIEND